MSGTTPLSVAAAIAANGARTLLPGTRIADTTRVIAQNISALLPLTQTGNIAGVDIANGGRPLIIDALRLIGSPFTIALTDSGVPAVRLPVWADAASNYHDVIANITTPFTLALDGMMRATRVVESSPA